MKVTTAQLLLEYLDGEQVEYIFGVPGTSLIPLYDALNKQDAIKPILTKHEEGAVLMADGYAGVSGKLGVCYSTSGPGATNLVTGLVHELQSFDLGDDTVSTTFKEIDCARIAEGLGAQGYRIQEPGELEEVLPKALESGKPTVIDVKIDPNEVPPIEGFVYGVERLNNRLAYL